MKMIVLSALLITLPAIAVVVFLGRTPVMLIPAMASLCVASVPFLGFAWYLRNLSGEADDTPDH